MINVNNDMEWHDAIAKLLGFSIEIKSDTKEISELENFTHTTKLGNFDLKRIPNSIFHIPNCG